MDKKYFWEFQKKMFRLHLKAAVLCAVVAISLLVFMDSQFNGLVIDMIEYYLGRKTALWVMHRETGFVIGFICLCIFGSFLALEYYYMKKTDRIFRNIGVLFQKDDRYLTLDEEFALLEDDLNGLKRASMRSEKLVQMENKHKLDIITYLAHDIRTPLSSVIGYLCLLDEAGDLPEETRKRYIALTLEKAYRLDDLVNEFFDITRLHVGKYPLERDDLNLACLMQQLADELYPMAEKRENQICVDVPDHLEIHADPDKIARVFTNIVKNALTYCRYGTPITIVASETCRTREGEGENWEQRPVCGIQIPGVEVLISNEGQGIPQEEQEKIFDQFYRLDQSRNSYTGGSGLGLAIAKEIVREHGGRIWAESSDTTTTFGVWLPCKKGWDGSVWDKTIETATDRDIIEQNSEEELSHPKNDRDD